jgi:hypothetical protein
MADDHDADATAPNQGAPGGVQPERAAEAAEAGGAGPARAEVNQGAPGAVPAGAGAGSEREVPAGSPLGADLGAEQDPFAERPEIYVGAAFAGGFLLAQFLRWIRR